MNYKKWLKLSVFNLTLVTLIGAIMRYKIGFEFPWLNQKHLQHAHSHFAFSGWVTHSIYVLILYSMPLMNRARQELYTKLIVLNLTGAYGMLIFFAIQGYGAVSIFFSMITVLTSYLFAHSLFKDLNLSADANPARNWFKAAMLFNVISSAGTFALAYLMLAKQIVQNWYLASVYFYLHFQYNGFFTFACFGILIKFLPALIPAFQYRKQTFVLFLYTCVPTYFLSTLWANIPAWLYIIVVLASLVQVLAWFNFLKQIPAALHSATPLFKKAKLLLLLAASAFTIKLLLQLGSTVPSLSKLAFGFRPVVIAYLHLILLGVISVFLLWFTYINKFIAYGKWGLNGLVVFITGVYLNEIVLAIQGISSFKYILVPYVNELLFGISCLMFTGLICMFTAKEKDSLVLHTDLN